MLTKLRESSLLTCLTHYGLLRGWGMFRYLKLPHAGMARGTVITAPVPRSGATVQLRYGTADMRVFRHVMLKEDCRVSSVRQPAVIIDAGAHIGMVSVYYALKYPQARILAIEPEPDNFALLRQNTKAFANITPINAALLDHTGQVALHNPDGETWTFKVLDNAGATPEPGATIVPTVTVEQLMNQYQFPAIDILKLDIEGSEVPVLRHAQAWINRVKVLLVETHDRFCPGCTATLLQAIAGRPHTIRQSSDKHVVTFTQAS